MKTKIIAILLSCIGLQVQARTGTEGHGGDPLRQLFDDSREYAADRVQQAKPCAFNVDVRPEVVSWIMNHQMALAADIRTSPHTWVTDTQSTCAFTQTQQNFPITFSFEACRPSIHEANDAIFILAHESSHHFGVVDETFADEVGRAIERLGQNSSCSPQPSIDPFDPNSCPGRQVSASELYSWIPLPSSTSKELGIFTPSIRQRICYSENLCTDWKSAENELRSVLGTPVPQIIPQINGGKVWVQLINNVPQVNLSSGVIYGPSWGMVGTVNEQQKFNVSIFSSEPYNLWLHSTHLVGSAQFKGWITPTCLRETFSTSSNEKDGTDNNITVETEMVILSNF